MAKERAFVAFTLHASGQKGLRGSKTRTEANISARVDSGGRGAK